MVWCGFINREDGVKVHRRREVRVGFRVGPRDSGIQGAGPGMVANREIFVTPT